MNLSINNSYPSSTTTATANKVNGRQQTVMTANFADMLNANMATSAKSATTATTSTDKVTLSTQATQTTTQDDIEVEAQKLAQKVIDNPNWAKDPFVIIAWSDGEHLLENNQKVVKQLQGELKSISGRPQTESETKRYYDLRRMISTVTAFGDKQDFTDEALLKRQTEINTRYYEIMSSAVSKTTGSSYVDLKYLM